MSEIFAPKCPPDAQKFGQSLLNLASQLGPRARSIKQAAIKADLNLTPERLAYLAKLAKEPGEEFFSNGLRVMPPVGPHPKSISDMNFTPITREGLAATSPHPQEATRFLLTSLVELQNYGLLVDAGQKKRPDIMRGETNRNLARVATHFGFSIVDYGSSYGVSAPFEAVHDAVFSERMQTRAEMLSQRLATMQPHTPRPTIA